VRQFEGHKTVLSAEEEDVEFQRRLFCQIAEPFVEFCIPEEVHPVGWFVAIIFQYAEADGRFLPHEKFVQFLRKLIFHYTHLSLKPCKVRGHRRSSAP